MNTSEPIAKVPPPKSTCLRRGFGRQAAGRLSGDWISFAINSSFRVVFFLLVITSICPAQFTLHIFTIEHNSNRNKLYYEARITKDGILDARKPVHAYWIMWEKDSGGAIREELTMVEKKIAYGFKITPEPGNTIFKMVIVAFPERAIRVYLKNGKAVAEVPINGRPSYLEKIFINSSDALPLPKVNYLEFFGTDTKTGERRNEKVASAKK